MTIIVFQPEPLFQFPPTISLLSVLSEKHNVVFLSCSDNTNYASFFKEKNIEEIVVVKKLRFRDGLFPALIEQHRNVSQLWKIIQENSSDDTIVWLTTEKAAVYLGNKLKNSRFVMQLMELLQVEKVNSIYPFGKKVNLKEIAQKARVLIVPEYNRSRIQSVWWNLNIPVKILPNKQDLHPRINNIPISNSEAKKTIDEISASGKKIILYQGVFHRQRSLEPFIKACEHLSEKYVLLLMGAYTQALKELLELSPVVKHIPWIEAPAHLEVTSWAHIGILSYIPGKIRHLSELNALYCAPNKIFEYSGFGIPMLANECPPLRNEFEKWNIGMIVDLNDINSIISGIDLVERDYDDMKNNCMSFFDHIKIRDIVDDIITVAAKN